MVAAPSSNGRTAPFEGVNLGSSPSGASIAAAQFRSLIERCESATDDTLELINLEVDLCAALGVDTATRETPAVCSVDAALGLLLAAADWRRFTPVSMSVFAASPYNAAAQTRHDGYGPTPALQLCSAILKMKLAPILKTLAAEARRAA